MEETIEEKYLSGEMLLKSEFNKGDADRTDLLERAERYAGWTLPNIFPDNNFSADEEMQNDYQSVGARAVTNLSNKIMMALFQPSKPFFRMQLTPKQREDITSESGMTSAQVDEALSEAERASMRELDKLGARVVMNDVVQNLIVTGNSLLFIPEEGKLSAYTLRDYVLTRDLRGGLVKLIIRETKSMLGLSEELAALAHEQGYGEEDEVSIYTCAKRVGKDRFIVWQELEEVCYCHKGVGYYPADDLPWIPLSWNLNRNKDYGTGLVENYAGDFHTMSTLAEAILDYTTLITDVKNLVDPAGMTDVREITEAPSGAYVTGREADIFVHQPQVGNNADFLTNQFEAVERRIGAAFLLNTAVTRNAERVTAEEIRMQANELEGSLGGVYSRLATELQLPLARRLLAKLNETFKDIEPIIVTGLESLSRNSELDQLRLFFQDFINLAELPPEVARRIDYADLIAVLGAGHGVDYKKFLKDEDTVKREQQEAIQANAQMAGAESQAVEAGKQQAGTP